ncbi:MAG: serine--tRNA ligase, partial [Leptospirales bacterium]|nr:serine--tRNA ligase [Leptospirales bacterium]
MIDPRIIREDIGSVRRLLEVRRMQDAVDLDELSRIDNARRALIAAADELREKRNKASKEIGLKKAKGEDVSQAMLGVAGISDEIKALDEKLSALNESFTDLHLSIPNMLDESVPTGRDDSENLLVREWGEKRKFDFEPKPHYEIGTELGILDFERGVKLAGARFYVYRGLAARLERAIINFML